MKSALVQAGSAFTTITTTPSSTTTTTTTITIIPSKTYKKTKLKRSKKELIQKIVHVGILPDGLQKNHISHNGIHKLRTFFAANIFFFKKNSKIFFDLKRKIVQDLD